MKRIFLLSFFNFSMALTSGKQDGLDGPFRESFRLPQPSTPLLPLAYTIMKWAHGPGHVRLCACGNAGTLIVTSTRNSALDASLSYAR